MKEQMTKKTLALATLAASSALLLSACGGSSSSSSSSSSSDPTEPQYDTQGVFTTAAPASNTEELKNTFAGLNEGFADDVSGFIDEVGAEFEDGADCASGEMWSDGTVDEDGPVTTWRETIDFDTCVITTASWGKVTLNGRVEFFEKETDWSEPTGADETRQSFDIHGTINDGDDDVVLSGSTSWRFSWDDNTGTETVRLLSPRLEFVAGNEYFGMLDVELFWQDKEVQQGGSYTYPFEERISGRIGSTAAGGYLELGTPTTVRGPDWGACPTEGVITIAGNASVEARFGIDTGIGKAVTLEINSNAVAKYDDCQVFYDEFDLFEDVL